MTASFTPRRLAWVAVAAAVLTIGLKGDISGGTPVAQLIAASAPTDEGCPGGIVDPVGLQ